MHYDVSFQLQANFTPVVCWVLELDMERTSVIRRLWLRDLCGPDCGIVCQHCLWCLSGTTPALWNRIPDLQLS